MRLSTDHQRNLIQYPHCDPGAQNWAFLLPKGGTELDPIILIDYVPEHISGNDLCKKHDRNKCPHLVLKSGLANRLCYDGGQKMLRLTAGHLHFLCGMAHISQKEA